MGCPIKHPTCHRETEALCPTIDKTGNRVCVLGAPTTIYQIVPREDDKVDLTLSHVHTEHLKFIHARGGEITFDYAKLVDKPEWLEKHRETLEAHLKHLISMSLVREYPVIGRGPKVVTQRLSDAGRAIVQQILDRETRPELTAREIYRGPR